VIDLNPACEAMIEVLAGVADDHLTSPSPCTEYMVGDLIDHVDLVAQGATALALGSSELPDTGYSHLEPDWRDTVTQHVRAVGKAWDDPAVWEGMGKRAEVGPLQLNVGQDRTDRVGRARLGHRHCHRPSVRPARAHAASLL
jgi:uncharacterized protein (TIGR03086 family)